MSVKIDYSTYLPPAVRGLYRFDYDLSPLNWFKVGGKSDVFFKPKDLEDLCYFFSKLDKSVDVFVLGNGSNILIKDSGIRGVTIKLGSDFSYIKENEKDGELIVGASCLNHSLSKYCLENSIPSFEFLVGIPGTVGGGIAMNAGCYGSEFKDIIKKIKAVDREGNILVFHKDEIGFFYRGNNLQKDLIFVEAAFALENSFNEVDSVENKEKIREKMQEISSIRQKTQPIKEKTCGSSFRNPTNNNLNNNGVNNGVDFKAWKLIDDCGLRGYVIGGAKVSEIHPNFLINYNNASSDDIENLITEIKKRVLQKFNIDLHLELKTVGI